MSKPPSSDLPRISEAEWEVMKAVWDEAPVTANAIAERLVPEHDWSPQTVKTMINRLVNKGALAFRVDGKRQKQYLYSAKVTRRQCIRHEGRSFLSRVFDGQEAPMLSHFLKGAKLSGPEIDELRRILEEKGD